MGQWFSTFFVSHTIPWLWNNFAAPLALFSSSEIGSTPRDFTGHPRYPVENHCYGGLQSEYVLPFLWIFFWTNRINEWKVWSMLLIGSDQAYLDNNSSSTSEAETEQTSSSSRKFQRNRTSFISDQVALLEKGDILLHKYSHLLVSECILKRCVLRESVNKLFLVNN